MEAATLTRRKPAWLAGLAPLVVLALAIGLFVAFDAPGLDRIGVPEENLSVERTVLAPGEIELHVRNDGADPVEVRQVIVNDAFAAFDQSNDDIGRLGGSTIDVQYPWIEGQAYEVILLTATGATITHEIEAAVETPDADLGFYGLMALIGIYVGVIPVTIGMLWLPWMRSVDARWMRFLLAFTIGLLAFLGVDALLEGTEIADSGPGSFGGAALVWLGAAAAYLALAGVDGWLGARRARLRRRGRGRRAAAGPAASAIAPRSSSRSASACTTSARGSRSGPPTRSDRWLSARRSWSGSRCTTRPRGSRSSRRSRARVERGCSGCFCSVCWRARPPFSAPGSGPPPSTRAWRRSCSGSAPGRSPRLSSRSRRRCVTRAAASFTPLPAPACSRACS